MMTSMFHDYLNLGVEQWVIHPVGARVELCFEWFRIVFVIYYN